MERFILPVPNNKCLRASSDAVVNVIKRLLVAIVVLLCVVFIALLLYVQHADLNRHRPAIETQLSRLLDREIRIAGDLEIKVFPAAFIRVEQLSIANAAWGSEEQMARIGLLSARVKLLSLLASPLEIEEIIARDVKLLVEANGEGNSNWDFAGDDVADKKGAGQGEWRGLIIGHADVSGVTLIRRQPQSQDRVVHLDTATLDTDAAGVIAMQVDGRVLDQPLQLIGHSVAGGEQEPVAPNEFTLSGHWGGLKIQLDGNVHALSDLSRARLRAKLTSEKIESTIAALEMTLPFSGPLFLEVALDPGKKIKLHGKVNAVEADASASIGKHALEFDGRLAPLDKLGNLFELEGLPPQALAISGEAVPRSESIKLRDVTLQLQDNRFSIDGSYSRTGTPSKLKLRATGTSLAQLSHKLPELAYESSGEVSFVAETVNIDKLQAKFGDSDLNGSLQIQRHKPVALKARLHSRMLDLKPFQATPAGDSKAKAAAKSRSGGKNKRYVLSDERLPLDALAGIDADVIVRSKKLLSQQIPLHEVELDASLRGGDLEAQFNFLGPQGGRSANKIIFATSGSLPTLDVLIQGRKLRLNLAAAEVSDFSKIPPTDITVKLVSRGNSLHKLAATANGTVILSQGPGRVESGFLDKFSSDLLTQLLSALNPFAETETHTLWDCGVYRLDVVNGLANLAALYAQTKNIKVVGGGSIDFNTERLNIEFNTKPRKGIGVSADMFVTPFVALKGTLARPQIGLNQKGALVASGAAIATGGISLLVKAAADRAAGAVDRCQQHRDDFARHTPMPETRQQ